MKINEFTRVGDVITAILEDGREVVLDWGYIADKKPQVGDEYQEPEVQETQETIE